MLVSWGNQSMRMLLNHGFLLLTSIAACTGSPPSADEAAIDPSDPASIARWEVSDFNAFHSKLEVVALRCFRGKMTDKGHPEAKPVAVEMCGARDQGVAGEQEEAVRRFAATEPELYAKVRAAIYDKYRKSLSTYKQAWSMGARMYGGRATEVEEVLPEIVKGNELDGLIAWKTIYIARPEMGVSRIGITLECPWDEENGMGVVIAGSDVERVGDASSVMLGVTPRPPGLTDLKNGNVALYVSNMASEPSVIDIHVQVDGVTVVETNFTHEVQRPFARYRVNLTPGKHRLKVESIRGQASLSEDFVVNDQAHVAAAYYHPQAGLLHRETNPFFTFHKDDRPWLRDSLWRPGQ
jgi:hypothetical protein